MRRRFPQLWPEWEDMIEDLTRAGFDLDDRRIRGLAFWINRLAETPVSHEQVTIISAIIDEVIAGIRTQNTDIAGTTDGRPTADRCPV
jgi:hypothetical protein